MKQMYTASNLKRLRTYYSLTQEEVASGIGISRQSYSNYERGIRVPDLETAARFAAFYHMTVDCLVWAEDPVTYWEKSAAKGYGVLNEVGQIIPVSGHGARMIQKYLACSGEGQKEIEFFAECKEKYERMTKKAGK